ncbi:MAG: elongation factor P [Elusimicrobia bacterium]|nr:elongation factor P [Elusimicrobiota bacterium]
MTVDTSQFTNGLYIYVGDKLFEILWFQHHKPGKGGAIMRTKLRDLSNGATIEKTFRAGEKFASPAVSRSKASYLYEAGENLVFMDTQTYEQYEIRKDILADRMKFLVEGMEVMVVKVDDSVLTVELPPSVEVEVEYTEQGVKGDTVSNVQKPAVLKNGLEIKVPLFVKTGDIIKVDTRTGKYVERV